MASSLSLYVIFLFLFVCHPSFVFPQKDLSVDTNTRCMKGTYMSSDIPIGNGTHRNETIEEKCAAFYNDYVQKAGDFTSCELKHSRPFRMCSQCVIEYKLAAETYNDVMTAGDLGKCRTKYITADRVQIIPSMQRYIQNLWEDAACTACSTNVVVDHCTGKVNYSIPGDVTQFMHLFQNLSMCLNSSLEDGNIINHTDDYVKGNLSVCRSCLNQYRQVNSVYSSMTRSKDGNICMDIVDRMNYTRSIWSHHFGCSFRKGNDLAVIMVTVFFALLPFVFYTSVYFCCGRKVTKPQVIKQKRLASASGNFNQQSSQSQSISDGIFGTNYTSTS